MAFFFASFSRTLRVSYNAVLRDGTGCKKAPKMRERYSRQIGMYFSTIQTYSGWQSAYG
jgi:hypothetical protein